MKEATKEALALHKLGKGDKERETNSFVCCVYLLNESCLRKDHS